MILDRRRPASGGGHRGRIDLVRLGAALCGLLLFAAGCAAPRGTTTADTSPAKPYVRALHHPDGTAALEVALRSLRPPRGRGPVLWLVGVTHLGAGDYYADLQRFLDAQSLVLFEGVGATNNNFQLQQDRDFNLQADLARALGLKFQLQAIDYARPHFQNSDLTVQELVRILSGQSAESAVSSSGTGGGDTEFSLLVDAMRGTGFLGALARVAVALVEASPRLQAVTQVVLVEVLSALPNDLPSLPGLPAGFQHLLRILIEERNRKVVEDVRHAVGAKPRLRSIAIFYGAGHMTDLEQRLRTALGYRVGEERWLTAFTANPRRAGVSEWELKLMQSWVRRQMRDLP